MAGSERAARVCEKRIADAIHPLTTCLAPPVQYMPFYFAPNNHREQSFVCKGKEFGAGCCYLCASSRISIR